MESESFTIRMPLELKQEIERRSGKGKRSELIIQLLRESLGLTEKKSTLDSTPSLASKLVELQYQFEIMKTEQDKILQRLTKLENPFNVKPDTPWSSPVKPEIGIETQHLTEIEANEPQQLAIDPTQNTTNNETPTLPDFDLESVEAIPIEAQKMSSSELLAILKKEEPVEKWSPQKLQRIREGNKAKSWKIAGNCRFIYASEKMENRKKGHSWWVIFPYSKS